MDRYYKPRSLPRACGFSLVELMVTLAVASILLVVAIPSFTNLRLGNALSAQANEMLGTLDFARSEAIRLNIPVTLCRAASATATACAGASGTWQSWLVLEGANVARRGLVPANGLSQTSNLSADSVTFGADGLARTNNALVNNQRLQIQIASSAAAENTRCVVLGAGSRISVDSLAGNCP